MEITQEVRMFLEKHEIGEKDCLLVALSGGRDSMCLLHILMELRPQMRYQLRATYVHHGLREEADEEAVWLAKSCEDWDVLFSVRKVDVQERVERTKESIEEAARNLRYQALLEESAKWDAWILMGTSCPGPSRDGFTETSSGKWTAWAEWHAGTEREDPQALIEDYSRRDYRLYETKEFAVSAGCF